MSNQQFVLNQKFGENQKQKTRTGVQEIALKIKPICKVSQEAVYIQIIWEFDPGSGLTLAAHIRHASRTEVVTNRVKDLSGTKNVTMALVADWWVTRKEPAY